MTGWKITLQAPQDMIPRLEEAFYDPKSDDFPTLSDFEQNVHDPIRLVEVYFTAKPDLTQTKARLRQVFPDFDLAASRISLTPLPDQDWVSESQRQLHPVDTGLFFVYGSHDADKIPADRLSLLIDAGQAFGTGHHETTHGCLLAIGDLFQNRTGDDAPRSALDLGCGSGVLGLAIRRLWPIPVMASDNDPVAVETCRQNAAINAIDLTFCTSDGLTAEILHQAGPYDLIVANILAGPLQDMAPDIAAHLSPTGRLILAGLLDEQEEAVCATYAAQGLTLIKAYRKNGWPSLLLGRV